MAISKDEVKRIAELARLGLSEAEVRDFQTQLEVILEYIDKLKKVDVSQTKPTAHVMDIKNVYRSDEVKPSVAPEKIFRIAPAHGDGFFRVPKVIE